jgi:hypothetical protein
MGVKLGHSLGDECRLRMFENKLMWRIFWPKRDEITGEWGKTT